VEGGKERRNGGGAIGGKGEMGRSRMGGNGGRIKRGSPDISGANKHTLGRPKVNSLIDD